MGADPARASTSRAGKRRTCAAAASRSPSPETVTRAVPPCWVTLASARDQSASTPKTVSSRCAWSWTGSAAGVKPSQKALLVASDQGPST